jgi:sulfate permease, SulP family
MAAVRLLFPTAITLALVQVVSVMSLGKAFAARHGYAIRPNRELLALGGANLLGGLFQSTPVSGSFARTAVNVRAGAHTPLAGLVVAGVVVVSLLALTPLFTFLPVAVLAAIIIGAATTLVDVGEVRFLFRSKHIEGVLALVTFVATLLIGIQEGVLIGVGASVAAIMLRISRPNFAVLGHLPGTRSFRDLRRNSDAVPIDNLLMLRVDASFCFANAEFLKDLILARTRKEHVRAVIIDASSINDLDTTAAAVLIQVADILRERNVELCFGGVKEPVYETMVRSGLVEQVGAERFFLSPHRAVRFVLRKWGRELAYLERTRERTKAEE